MPKAQLYHLPLGFSTLYKPDPLRYCNLSNCFNFSPINIDLIKILSCGHTYHTSCYNNNRLKYLHYLLFLQNSINEHVKSLLKHLQRFNKQEVQVNKSENDIPCDNNDETELINYIAYALEQALQEFQLQ
ncbi:10261_t:CDS:1 [Funneliformis caledonium]|uniref:10261_t:CDS:1 n=1 Tax=Funneliformis caledonium TaxID=1117310 RepID=A0A9N9B849_9GLOM|nr:10261_t:CDS:1 [Funneliformis caledonium]